MVQRSLLSLQLHRRERVIARRATRGRVDSPRDTAHLTSNIYMAINLFFGESVFWQVELFSSGVLAVAVPTPSGETSTEPMGCVEGSWGIISQPRPNFLNCFGMHEWAMLYQPDGERAPPRHQQLPLRLEQAALTLALTLALALTLTLTLALTLALTLT